MSRSIVVRMRRRAPGEHVEPWRLRINGPDAQALGDRLLEWSSESQHRLGVTWPAMPAGIEDRNADVWEALLAVADLAGGEWPGLARRSAVALVADPRGRTPSLGVTLLRDLRTIFADAGTDKLSTETILEALVDMDESPWGDLRGKPLDARGLSRRLAKFEVKPKNLRIDGKIPKGYTAADLTDPWTRYLDLPDTPPRYIGEGESVPGADPPESATTATPLQVEVTS